MTIRYFLISVSLFVGIVMEASGASYSGDDLPAPDSVKGIGKSPPDRNELTVLLGKKEFLEFYRSALDLHRRTDPNLNDIDSIGSYFWFCYYVASTPLFSLNDYDDKTTAVTYDNVDLTVRWELQDCFLTIARNKLDQLVEKHGLSRRELAALFCSYAARMLRDVRSVYDPNLDEKIKKVKLLRENEMAQLAKRNSSRKRTWEEIDADIKEWMERNSNFNGKVTLNGNRNSKISSSVELMEWEFLQTLVKLYPGKKAEVMKYIKLAGYEHGEAYDLIDRTAFLYKGRPKFPSNLDTESRE